MYTFLSSVEQPAISKVKNDNLKQTLFVCIFKSSIRLLDLKLNILRSFQPNLSGVLGLYQTRPKILTSHIKTDPSENAPEGTPAPKHHRAAPSHISQKQTLSVSPWSLTDAWPSLGQWVARMLTDESEVALWVCATGEDNRRNTGQCDCHGVSVADLLYSFALGQLTAHMHRKSRMWEVKRHDRHLTN